MVSWLLIIAGLLVVACAAVSQEDGRLIRQEKKWRAKLAKREAEVGPHGGFSALQGEVKDQKCDESFFYGGSATSCPLASAITLPSMCTLAAAVLKLSRGNPKQHDFVVNASEFDIYPIGCFKKDSDTALWFNPIPDSPKNLTSSSRPVCRRPNYKLGDINTNDGGCTDVDDYKRILDEETCRTFADCKNYCMDPEFRVGLEAPTPREDYRSPGSTVDFYDQRPIGCFIDSESKCVRFNVPKKASPTTPSGTPVCKAAANGID